MSEILTVGGGKSDVTISGLESVDSITEATFDGITLTLTGAEVDNFGDLTVKGGAAENEIGVRRIIWNGKVDGVERNTVLIVDNVSSGTLRGGWLIFGNEENYLTYYTEPAKITAESSGEITEDAAAINLQFTDKKTALTPRTFTFMEKYSMLSLGSSFDNVTISAHNDIYLSRSNGKIISGVIKGNSKAQINGGQWTFENKNSFVVETENEIVKIYGGSDI